MVLSKAWYSWYRFNQYTTMPSISLTETDFKSSSGDLELLQASESGLFHTIPNAKLVLYYQLPAGCDRSFQKLADLERHYAVDPKMFPCDYSKCARFTKPFTRRDHYRDHLEDYHKEDIGKSNLKKNSSNMEQQRDQKTWQGERVVDPGWWRCGRCLLRQIAGLECRGCRAVCANKRVETPEKPFDQGSEWLSDEDHEKSLRSY